MQNAEHVKLTELQKQKIQHFDAEMATELLHECAERLGLVTVCEYCLMTKEPRRTVYDRIKNNKITNTEFCGQKLIILNDL